MLYTINLFMRSFKISFASKVRNRVFLILYFDTFVKVKDRPEANTIHSIVCDLIRVVFYFHSREICDKMLQKALLTLFGRLSHL